MKNPVRGGMFVDGKQITIRNPGRGDMFRGRFMVIMLMDIWLIFMMNSLKYMSPLRGFRFGG